MTMAERYDIPQSTTNEVSSKAGGEMNKDSAVPSNPKRKLDENTAPGAKRSRTDKNDIESALDPEADYNDETSNQAKPRSNPSKGKAKPTKQTNASTNEKSSNKPKASTKKSASTNKSATTKKSTATKKPVAPKTTAATKRPVAPRKPVAARNSASIKRKESPKGSGTSTEDQIEVDGGKPILVQNDQDDYSNIDPVLRPKPNEGPADMITSKTLQISSMSHTEKLQSLAQAGVVTLQMSQPTTPSLTKKHSQMKDSIQQNVGTMTPKALNGSHKVTSNAPVAPMARISAPQVKAVGSADTIQVVASKEQQTSEAQQTNGRARDSIVHTSTKPSQANSSPKPQGPKAPQTNNMSQDLSTQKPLQVHTITASSKDQSPKIQQHNNMVQGQSAQEATKVQKEITPSKNQNQNSKPKEVAMQDRIEQTSINVQRNPASTNEQSPKAQREDDVTRNRAIQKAVDTQSAAEAQKDIATSKNQSPKPQPANAMGQDPTAPATVTVQAGVASPEQQNPKAQQIDSTTQNRPAKTAPKARNKAPPRQQKATKKQQTKKTAPKPSPQAVSDVREDIASTQHQNSQPQPTINVPQDAHNNLVQTDADLQRDIASHQRDSPSQQQIDHMSRSHPIQANARAQETANERQQNPEVRRGNNTTSNDSLQPHSVVQENIPSEQPQATASQRLEHDEPPDETPGSSESMAIEYGQIHLQMIEETAFYDRGFQWNEILQSREELLEFRKLIVLPGKKKDMKYWVTKCPLSAKGKKTIRVLGSDLRVASLDSKRVSRNMQEYQTEPNIPPELIQADLYHIIIPRLIRYIHMIYTGDSTDVSELEMLDSLSVLLKALSELCNFATNMEKHSEGHSGTVLLGLHSKLVGPLDQIIESTRGIKGEIDQQRRLLLEELLRQREEDRERRQQRREEIQRQEEKDSQEQKAIYRREQERRYLARLTEQARAKKQKSEQYWQHELPSSHLVLSEILSTENPDDRMEQRKSNKRRAVSGSFVWTGALTDVLIDELRKHQDLDIHDRYEQCLKREPLRHLSIGEIRRRALEVKPWLAEQWLEMKGSVPLYVWTIE